MTYALALASLTHPSSIARRGICVSRQSAPPALDSSGSLKFREDLRRLWLSYLYAKYGNLLYDLYGLYDNFDRQKGT